jgi:DNA-binding GntR family transcriptional regulator
MSKSDETRQLTDSEQQTFHELYQKYHERVYSICGMACFRSFWKTLSS